jgi:hypothetical protein
LHRKVSPGGRELAVGVTSSHAETGELIPGGSKGMTQHGSPSALWLYASKPVGGEGRQIRLPINAEQRMKAGFRNSDEPSWQEKCLARSRVTVPQTDTGRRVENTKAIGRTLVKELGKLAP